MGILRRPPRLLAKLWFDAPQSFAPKRLGPSLSLLSRIQVLCM
jgi:hypothetical protein